MRDPSASRAFKSMRSRDVSTPRYRLAGAATPVAHRHAFVMAGDAARACRAGCAAVLVEVGALGDRTAITREQGPRDAGEHHDENRREDPAAPCECNNSHEGEARNWPHPSV